MTTQAPPAPNDAVQADPGEVQPVAHETADRIATGTITALPFIALGIVCWQAWSNLLRWSDVAVFLIMYVLTGLGVTVGFHRHLTHRSFKTHRWLRGLLSILGSVAIEGPVISGSPTTASTTPTPTRRATRTARTSATSGGFGARSRGSSMPTSAGSSSTPIAARASATPAI